MKKKLMLIAVILGISCTPLGVIAESKVDVQVNKSSNIERIVDAGQYTSVININNPEDDEVAVQTCAIMFNTLNFYPTQTNEALQEIRKAVKNKMEYEGTFDDRALEVRKTETGYRVFVGKKEKNIKDPVKLEDLKEVKLNALNPSNEVITKEDFKIIQGFDNTTTFELDRIYDGSQETLNKNILLDNVLIKDFYHVPYSEKVPYYGDMSIYCANQNNDKRGYYVLNVEFKEGFDLNEVYSGVMNLKGVDKKGNLEKFNSSSLSMEIPKKVYDDFLNVYPDYLANGKLYPKYEHNKTYTFIYNEKKDFDIDKFMIFSEQDKKGNILLLNNTSIKQQEL